MLSFNRVFPPWATASEEILGSPDSSLSPKSGKSKNSTSLGRIWGTTLTIQPPSHRRVPHPGPGCSMAHPTGGAAVRGGQAPGRWRKKDQHGVCVSVPTWPDSPDLFADKGFIFLSQRCSCKINRAKPLELLPARARCRRTPAHPESPAWLRNPSGISPKTGSLVQVLCPSQGHGKPGIAR